MKKLSMLILSVFVLCACSGKGEKSKLEQIETDTFAVETETVSLRDVKLDLLITGSIKAWEEAIIFPRVDGKLLENVLKEGDKVKRNQSLALIERDEVGAVYEPVLVPSTINGVIGKTYLDPGANVTRSTPVAMVVNQENVRVVIDVPERYIGKIRLGQEASFTVEAFGNREFKAQVYKISPVVDAQSRVVTVELKADNSEGSLKSGMFAKVKLVLEEKKNIPAVNLTSVQSETAEDGSVQNYVYIVNADGSTVSKKAVEIGLKSTSDYEVLGGVNTGDEIIKIVFGIKDGSKIKVENK
ncbi:MAG: efflux RND transporter periplasmic adaptor subunit [Elusimicrobia bacterium]|nr:efflux RND transporter periplasmic adaptor subunit [Elusimicrobiota bacterium]